jgi:beta-aspartyl-peptidase (threonine type)
MGPPGIAGWAFFLSAGHGTSRGGAAQVRAIIDTSRSSSSGEPMFRLLMTSFLVLLLMPGTLASDGDADGERRWAIAIHGGAGVIPKSLPKMRRGQYFDALGKALALGRDLLQEGRSSVDVVEQVVRVLEDDPLFNAGRGAVYTHDGKHELDAAIMDGRDLSCGAVAGLRTVRNPISLARMVMEETRHVFLAGDGAEQFAAEMKVERVDQDYFHTESRRRAWQDAMRREREEGGDGPEEKGTVGAVALDMHGNLAAATSTGGLTNKKHGRVGDVPIIGAGTYASNRSCAVSGTGKGEEFIRNNVAYRISALMEIGGLDLQAATDKVIHQVLQEGDGGVIAVDAAGNVVMNFNSEGMFRGVADSGGRFQIGIWESLRSP